MGMAGSGSASSLTRSVDCRRAHRPHRIEASKEVILRTVPYFSTCPSLANACPGIPLRASAATSSLEVLTR